MQKAIKFAIIPSLAGAIVFMGLVQFVPFHAATNMDQLSTQGQYYTVFAVVSFLFGFLPCLLFGMAQQWVIDNAPVMIDQPEPEIITVAPAAPALYVGMVVVVPAAGCVVRVKALKNNYSFTN